MFTVTHLAQVSESFVLCHCSDLKTCVKVFDKRGVRCNVNTLGIESWISCDIINERYLILILKSLK
jgi:hypothetical protein